MFIGTPCRYFLLNINARSSILTDLFDLNNDDTNKHNYLKMDFGFVTVFVNSETRLKLQGAKNFKKGFTNSVQSSLKYHNFWVTLCIKFQI